MKIAFAEYAIPKGGVVVAGVLDDKSLTPGAAELDRRTGGAGPRCGDHDGAGLQHGKDDDKANDTCA